MNKLICLITILFVSPALATEPPKKAPTFGLGPQDACQLINGRWVCPQQQTAVVRQRSFGFPIRQVERTRTVQKTKASFGMVTSVSPVMVKETIQVPRTVTNTIEVPVQKTITVMEPRQVTETVYETQTVERLACPQPVQYVAAPVYVQAAPVQTRTVKRTRSGWFPGKILTRMIPSRFRTRRFSRSTVYAPAGQDVWSHLMGPPHNMPASYVNSLSYSQALAVHTAQH